MESRKDVEKVKDALEIEGADLNCVSTSIKYIKSWPHFHSVSGDTLTKLILWLLGFTKTEVGFPF
jgi:hypothetical protein